MAQEAVGVIEQSEDAVEERSTLIGGPPPSDAGPPDGPDDGDPFGGGGDDDEERRQPPLHNARLGMLMLLGAETMFFAGLIGSFFAVSRRQSGLAAADVAQVAGVGHVNQHPVFAL